MHLQQMLRSARLALVGRGRQQSTASLQHVCRQWLHLPRGPLRYRMMKSTECNFLDARYMSSKKVAPEDLPLMRAIGKRHLILMGPPGSGKTSIASILSRELGWKSIDVDNDILENVWGMKVSEKLKKLGDAGFQEAEGQAIHDLAKQLKADTLPAAKGETIILSLSGSNPLHRASFQQLAENGLVLFLDAPYQDILARLKHMRVNRIIGQASRSMEEILTYRRSFYESDYDARVLIGSGQTTEQIAMEALRVLKRPQHFLSTRGAGLKHTKGPQMKSFRSVVQEGLAADRGLYVPSSLLEAFAPRKDGPASRAAHMQRLERLLPLGYSERVLRLLEQLPLADLKPPKTLRTMLQKAYGGDNFLGAQSQPAQKNTKDSSEPDVLPVVPLEGHHYLLELFQGPTASFKDLALQLTPQLVQNSQDTIDPKREQMVAILVATSGDTGTAALDGFAKHTSFPMVVLYPKGGVSSIQELQMLTATPADQIMNLVKGIFNDTAYLAELNHKFRDKAQGKAKELLLDVC
eukprot:g37169.t1